MKEENYQFEHEDISNTPNTEIDDYRKKEFNRELEELEEIDRRMRIKKIGCFVLMGVFVVFIIIGLARLVSSGSKAATSTPGNGSSKTPSTPSHSQETSWSTDPNGNQYRIVAQYERKSTHYTQGLYYGNGIMVESGGLYGQSSLQYLKVDEEGKFILLDKKIDVPSQFFAEGCDVVTVDNQQFIYQLTWLENKIFKYDMDLKLVQTFEKPAALLQGWGITHNPATPCSLIISDSSATLHTVDCKTMEVTSSITIKKNNSPLQSMNELEFVEDYLLANVYLTKSIEIIDLKTGSVVRSLDMTKLLDLANQERAKRGLGWLEYSECLNGIAYDWNTKELWVTGKDWPLFFKIKLPEEYLKRPAN